MKKILIIQTASIGDVILATPLLENLHRKYPDAVIDMMVKKGTESLFASHLYLGKLYIWNKSDHKLRNLYDILKEIQSERYDLLINVQRFFLTGLVTAFSRAKKTIGFNRGKVVRADRTAKSAYPGIQVSAAGSRILQKLFLPC